MSHAEVAKIRNERQASDAVRAALFSSSRCCWSTTVGSSIGRLHCSVLVRVCKPTLLLLLFTQREKRKSREGGREREKGSRREMASAFLCALRNTITRRLITALRCLYTLLITYRHSKASLFTARRCEDARERSFIRGEVFDTNFGSICRCHRAN